MLKMAGHKLTAASDMQATMCAAGTPIADRQESSVASVYLKVWFDLH